MSEEQKEIKVELTVTMDVKGIEHGLGIDVSGYTKSQHDLIDDTIRDGVDYLLESMRRRLVRI